MANFRQSETQKKLVELCAQAEQIQPMAEKDGQVYVNFEQAAVLNSLNALEPKTGMQTKNRDGSLASTGKTVHAINPDYFFLNRAFKKGKKLYVVSGHEPMTYRCIRGQANGMMPLKLIPAYVITRAESGELVVEGMINVDSKDFTADYTSTLSNAVMAELLPLIVNYEKAPNYIEEMPI